MLTIVLLYAALLYGTWVLFLAIMALKAARDAGVQFAPVVRWGGYLLLAVGLVADASLQLASTLLFFDLPRETLLTYRCRRYLLGPDGWRKTLARAICRNLLDPFQAGGHCHGGEQ